MLGIPHYVLHPGAHMDAGEQAGLQRIADCLMATVDAFGDGVTILLENTAGQGTALGYSFEQLRWLLENGPAERLGVCFDTAHALAAGYDLLTRPLRRHVGRV